MKTLNRKQVLTFFVFFIIFLTYSFSFFSPFYFDDVLNVRDNLALNSSLDSLNCTIGGIRPLSYYSFYLNKQFFGNFPFFFRIFNIIFHFIFAYIIYNFLTYFFKKILICKDKWIPLIIVVLWALHPINSQTVNYIVQRMTLLSSLFVFIGFAYYIKYKIEGNKLFLYLSICLFFIALGFKETGLQYLILIFCFELIYGSKKDFFKIISISIFLAIITIIFYFGINNLTSIPDLLTKKTAKGYSIYERLLTEPFVMVIYVKTLLLPFYTDIHLHYGIQVVHSFKSLKFILPVLSITTIVIYALVNRNKKKELSFFIICFFALLLPESSILPLDLAYQHRLYLPSLFFILFLVYFLKNLSKIFKEKNAFYYAIFFLLFFYSVNLIYRNIIYSNPISFYQNELEHCDTNPKIYNNFASVLLERGITENVLPLLKRCNDLGKIDYDTFQNYAIYYALKKDYGKSLMFLHKAEKLDNPKLYSVYLNLAFIYYQTKDFNNSKMYLDKAERIGNDVKLHNLRKLINKVNKK